MDIKPRKNKGNRHAAKPPTDVIYLRCDKELKREFEQLAGGSGRVLNKWLLQAAKEKASREM